MKMTTPPPPTHQEKIAYYVLTRHGFTEREGVIELNITSGRNYINEFEKLLNIKLHRQNEDNLTNKGVHTRYLVADKAQAECLIDFINGKRRQRKAEPITHGEAERILAKFKEQSK